MPKLTKRLNCLFYTKINKKLLPGPKFVESSEDSQVAVDGMSSFHSNQTSNLASLKSNFNVLYRYNINVFFVLLVVLYRLLCSQVRGDI